MPFTGVLGDGELGDLLLGSAGEATGPSTTFTCRARIRGTVTQAFTSRARISNASHVAAFTCRARILHATAVEQFQARARIRAQVSGGLEVSFRIASAIAYTLPVQFNATGGTQVFSLFSSRARIQILADARTSVDFTVEYQVPTTCVLRPTQRVGGTHHSARSGIVALFYCRARINSSVAPP